MNELQISVTLNSGSIVTNTEELKEQLSQILKLSEMDTAMRGKVEKLYNGLSENGNSVLLFGRLKQKWIHLEVEWLKNFEGDTNQYIPKRMMIYE